MVKHPSSAGLRGQNYISATCSIRVEKGDRIVITRHGREVAVLSPIEKHSVAESHGIGERRVGRQQGNKPVPKGMTIKDMINAGRKGESDLFCDASVRHDMGHRSRADSGRHETFPCVDPAGSSGAMYPRLVRRVGERSSDGQTSLRNFYARKWQLDAIISWRSP